MKAISRIRKIPHVYVAGKFSGQSREEVDLNIARAEEVGIELARRGLYPVIPHTNTSRPEFESAQPYEFWIETTLELMRGCDAVCTVPGWESSKGATKEVAEADAIGIPVFNTPSDAWIWSERRGVPETRLDITQLARESYHRAQRKGFYDPPPSVGDRISLIHSELSEALEAYRDDEMVTKIDENGKPTGFPSELADVVIRVADFAHYKGIDLAREIRVKSDYNETRPAKHGRVRM